MSFCTKCGTPRVAGSKFCTVCGAAQPPTEPLPQPSAGMPSPAAPPVYTPVPPAYTPVPAAYAPGNAPAPGPKKSNTLLKVIIAVLVILFIGAGLALAGLYYAAQKVKEKVHSVTAQVLTGAPSANAPSSPGTPPPPPAPSSFPGWSPRSASASNINNPAPAKAGMLVVTAIASSRGDYESMKQIVSIDDRGITLSYHSEGPKPGAAGEGTSSQSNSVAVERLVLAQDLNTAHDYAEVFNSNAPRSFPGTTAITASREVLTELKQKGSTSFSFRPQGLAGALGSLVGTFFRPHRNGHQKRGRRLARQVGKEAVQPAKRREWVVRLSGFS